MDKDRSVKSSAGIAAKEFEAPMRRFYQGSEDYLNLLMSVRNEGHYAAYIKYMSPYTKAGRLLDLGCGTGYTSNLFSRGGAKVVGIDLSFKFLGASSSVIGERLRFVAGSGLTLPFSDGSFDTVGTFDVIEHVPDVDLFLNEAIRVLKKGGRLVIVSPSIVTPFTPLKALFMKGGEHSVYDSKAEAFVSIFVNTALAVKKIFSRKADFSYRRPRIDAQWRKREDSAVYKSHPRELRRYLERRGFRVLKYQKDGPSLLHRVVGYVLPDFASTIYLVAEKVT